MKRFLLLISAALAASCIDKDYDLKNVDTGNIAIGGEESEFKMPLATVRVSMAEINQEGVDIEKIFKEARIWLPDVLPGSVDYIDIPKLNSDGAYITSLLNALIAQMKTDNAKLTKVTDQVWDKYKEEFLSLPGMPANPDAAQFKTLFKETFAASQIIQEQTREIAQQYLTKITIDPVRYDIGAIDLSDDVVKMLSENLDPRDTPAALQKNTLHLYGQIESQLPVSLQLMPRLTQTTVKFTVDVDALLPVNKFAPSVSTQIYADDLRQIIDGVTIEIPVELKKYYPGKEFGTDPGDQIVISLKLIKHGSLSLNL